MKLKSIDEEAADCRAAWRGKPIGTLALHCHHDVWLEHLIEDAESRIGYILRGKPEKERALRLRLFRPLDPKHLTSELDKALAEWDKACAEWVKARAEWVKARAEWGRLHHAAACRPGCPWDGKTIFP